MIYFFSKKYSSFYCTLQCNSPFHAILACRTNIPLQMFYKPFLLPVWCLFSVKMGHLSVFTIYINKYYAEIIQKEMSIKIFNQIHPLSFRMRLVFDLSMVGGWVYWVYIAKMCACASSPNEPPQL